MSPVVPQDLQTWFEGYLRVCNRHTFEELRHFVAEELVVDGRAVGRSAWIDELRALARGFPDYRWTLQHLLINPDGWLAARLITSGTHLGTFRGRRGTGTRVRAEQVSLYRLDGYVITELWTGTDRS
ncbi:putative ester cyclase [Friedmanniella endophytica]|uniref:Putative ester cyclase n=1 Tax=Microlunatus kandeliicorticis TaxID=1759536 RepID=A0A7W3P7A8_9ACTN|nr:ester cyclase [Microlunatus kandeliicorticis]MBA8795824.1 putative ester cyclase [Microlunatus kandeliicorticis]